MVKQVLGGFSLNVFQEMSQSQRQVLSWATQTIILKVNILFLKQKQGFLVVYLLFKNAVKKNIFLLHSDHIFIVVCSLKHFKFL